MLPQHFPKGFGKRVGREPTQINDFERAVPAVLFELAWFDQQRIYVHVLGSVFHAPLDPFDDDKVGEPIAIECVKEKKPSWAQDTACLGNEALWDFDVL